MIGHTDLAMADRYAHLTNRHKQIRQDEFAKYYRDGMCYYETGYKFKVQKAEKRERVRDIYQLALIIKKVVGARRFELPTP